jgi:hypothetical protein
MVLSLAEAGFFRPRWSREILQETERAICEILRGRGDENAETVARRQCAAIARFLRERWRATRP